jgi:glycerol kinase
MRYILALDQGTTSSRAVLVGEDGVPVAIAQEEFPQHYPRPGWVEHDPEDIWRSQLACARGCLERARISPSQVVAIGVANQRETTLIWDRATGRPLHNAIVWQCRRSAPICEELKASGLAEVVRSRTGLVLDPYFSATKLMWLLRNVPQLREKALHGEALFGTVDTYLIWRLSGGRLHITDPSNASRTMLFNLTSLRWDDELLEAFGIPREMLPEVRPSSSVYGEADPALLGARVPIASAIGDQQAALFGQGCFAPGQAKNTYGTGCFLLLNVGQEPIFPANGLLDTVAWDLGRGATYALEGSVFVAGAAIQWLRDELGIIASARESEELAATVADTGGVYFVPAFVGLGAPYWDPHARGVIAGLTRGSGRAHIVRAALEAICYQTRDVLEAMVREGAQKAALLRADGGAAQNNLLLQLQADILGLPIERPRYTEVTALGAAFLAGLAVGLWPGLDAVASLRAVDRIFEPRLDRHSRDARYEKWCRAVRLAMNWASPDEA